MKYALKTEAGDLLSEMSEFDAEGSSKVLTFPSELEAEIFKSRNEYWQNANVVPFDE